MLQSEFLYPQLAPALFFPKTAWEISSISNILSSTLQGKKKKKSYCSSISNLPAVCCLTWLQILVWGGLGLFCLPLSCKQVWKGELGQARKFWIQKGNKLLMWIIFKVTAIKKKNLKPLDFLRSSEQGLHISFVFNWFLYRCNTVFSEVIKTYFTKSRLTTINFIQDQCSPSFNLWNV